MLCCQWISKEERRRRLAFQKELIERLYWKFNNGYEMQLDYNELDEYVKTKKRLKRERDRRLRAIAAGKEVRRGK